MNPSAPVISDDAFATEEKLLGTLVSIRNAAISTEEKAAIRDLILDYAGTTEEAKRANLKVEITRRLAAVNASVSTKTTPTNSLPTKDRPDTGVVFGRSRPVPDFVASTPVIEQQKAPEAPKEIKILAPETPKALPSEPTKVAVVSAPVPTEEKSIPKEPSPSPENLDVKKRIDEIKHDINLRVGNPVNLISTDETIGKEYMAALLGAMKSAPSGGASASEALSRLENVYTKVNELLSKKDVAKKEVPKTHSTPTPVNQTSPQVVAPPAPNPAGKPETRNSSLVSNLIQKDKAVGEIVSKLQSVAPATTPINKSEQHKLTVQTDEVKEKEVDALINPNKLSPVSTITALPEQIETLRKKSVDQEDEAKKIVTDIKSEKVTAGLKQLLSEWKLFQGSGWFGTGPSGIDHPLYKSLANLSMVAVVSGRFEGATPEVKHILADYMSGWRYEQGIVHDMGESFEHYLRRVILHILAKPRDPSKPDQAVS